jgi:drug/metabolite transporter (DMT)-like permease
MHIERFGGEAAALGAASCWVVTSLAFAGAARRIGPTAVNVIRMLLALTLVFAIHRALLGHWLPRIDSTGIVYLGLSGLIGFALGDQFMFVAFVDIGARLSTLLMTITPLVAAALGWAFLGEQLDLWKALGMAVTLAGIAWVAVERPSHASRAQRHRGRGLICGSLAAICQAGGLMLSKVGIGEGRLPVELHHNAWAASLTRLAFGAASICILAGLHRAGRSATPRGEIAGAGDDPLTNGTQESVTRDGRVFLLAILLLSIGTILGPVVGVWCSLISVKYAQLGVAATLMAMTPVFILPFSAWIEQERVSWRAVAGAILAILGVATLTGVVPALLHLTL